MCRYRDTLRWPALSEKQGGGRIEVNDDIIRTIGNKALLEQIIAGRETEKVVGYSETDFGARSRGFLAADR